MVHRPVPGPDADPVRGRDRGSDIGLGGADRLGQADTLGEAGGDRRRQRAAGAMRVLRGDAIRGEAA